MGCRTESARVPTALLSVAMGKGEGTSSVHGFSGSASVPAGSHTWCVDGVKQGRGDDGEHLRDREPWEKSLCSKDFRRVLNNGLFERQGKRNQERERH